jgi:F0F1-type ATP synthase epsilon subunit
MRSLTLLLIALLMAFSGNKPLVSHTFELEIVTPERLVVRDSVEAMQIPGGKRISRHTAGHAPLITELGIGEITDRRMDSRTI